MGLEYRSLDEKTRKYMLIELNLGGCYESPRLKPDMFNQWKKLLEEGIKSFNDDWISQQTNVKALLKSHESRNKPKGGITMAKVPSNAAQQLAEGEFNRFYLRGICSRVISEGKNYLRIYRGKIVSSPRVESEMKIGKLINATELLESLRQSSFVDSAIGLPAGPNSGLTAEIFN